MAMVKALMNEAIEKQIEDVLKLDDIDSASLSRVLFWVGGLFQKLAPTEAERKVVSQSSLFQRALARIDELSDREEELQERMKAFFSKPNVGAESPNGTNGVAPRTAGEKSVGPV
jgi:hypothetical protein